MTRFILLLILSSAVAGCDGGKPSADGAAAAREFATYAARRAGCNHWGGEEAYDAARRAEINRAMAALKCGEIDRDEAALLQRYSAQPQLLQQIRAARDKLL